MRKKVLLLLVIVMSALVFAAGCSGGSSSNEAADSPDAEATAEASADDSEAASGSELIGSGKTVGITLPSKDMQRWIQDGDYLKAALENEGFTVDLQYAGNQEVPLQIQ
jgi:putative multiple sugar transport system substrate-binding protein